MTSLGFLTFAMHGCRDVGAPVADPAAVQAQWRRYHDSLQYERDLQSVIEQAMDYVTQRAGQVPRPAIVLDVDETALSNWPLLAANDFADVGDVPCSNLPQGPCGWAAWESQAAAPALAPVMDLYQQARRRGVAVFFVTGRYEAERAATESNLKRVGYRQWQGLYMRPDGDRRAAARLKPQLRQRIAQQGYTVIANVGDQRSDLAGGVAERSFLLPNPFYLIH